MAPVKRLTFVLDRGAATPMVTLRGAFDEGCGPALTDLRSELDADAAIDFDCEGVTQINSLGLRLWVQFLESFAGRPALAFHRCSTYFVDYANMSEKLVGGAKIVSVHVPFRCASCKASTEPLFATESVDWRGGFKDQACGKCGGASRPEAEPASFLAFMDPGAGD